MRIHIFVFLAIIAIPLNADAQQKSRKPNIVILLADDLGYADTSMHGAKDIKTPHIDSIAKNGVRCTNGYVSAPYCSPTRAGLLTGRYQQRFGHEFNPVVAKNGGKDGLPLDQRTIADILRAAGYVTGLIGKWHLGEEENQHPQSRGFNDFFGFLTGAHSYTEADDKNQGPILRGRDKTQLNGYLTDVLAKEATQFIERNKDKPFFLYLAFNAVHTPMEAPAATMKEFADVKDEKRRTYLAMTRKLDDAVGQVLAKLRELNLEEDTLVFFLSDNGGPTTKFAPNGSLNFPLRGSKGDTWEGGIRVPFVVMWKGTLPANKTYDHPVISLDILPTSLAASQFAKKAGAGQRYELDLAIVIESKLEQEKLKAQLAEAQKEYHKFDRERLERLIAIEGKGSEAFRRVLLDKYAKITGPLRVTIANTQKKIIPNLDGVDLLPFLEGKKADAPHDALYWRFGSQMAIRKGDWVLVRPSMGSKEYENIAKTALLFNLKNDIGQQNDLAAKEPERVRAMQAEWDRWNAGMIAPLWPATYKGQPFKNP